MNFKLYFSWAICLFCSVPLFSQQIKGQIIDATTAQPIAFATIQYGEENGVISNTEGFFSIASETLQAESILTISFMGYQSQSLSIKKLQDQDQTIKLKEAVNQLNTVYISNKMPRLDSILARMTRNLPKNYVASDEKYTIFSRETSYFNAKDLVVDIEKSSNFSKKQLDASNKQFKELTNQIVNNPPTQTFTDVLFDLYLKTDASSKMEVKQATKLTDRKNSLSLETIQKKVTNVILQHLDTTKTYKVKTGWFKIEDSLSFKKSKEAVKDSVDRNFAALKGQSIRHLKTHLFGKESEMDFVTDTEGYDYKLENATTVDDQLVYVITFKPRKSRAKFNGTLYIAEADYAILKSDFSYAEGKTGEKLNLKLLLGVKYVENVNKGTVIYKKNSENKVYYPYYINHESAQYVYAHRPFKFIENNEDAKNKVGFDMIIEGSMTEKYEVMSLDYQPMNSDIFNGITEAKTLKYTPLTQYDPSLWKDYSILEPLEELKKFKVEE